jgi:hypothetical protein
LKIQGSHKTKKGLDYYLLSLLVPRGTTLQENLWRQEAFAITSLSVGIVMNMMLESEKR